MLLPTQRRLKGLGKASLYNLWSVKRRRLCLLAKDLSYLCGRLTIVSPPRWPLCFGHKDSCDGKLDNTNFE